MLKTIEDWCKKWRVDVNVGKTKVVHFRPKKVSVSEESFVLNGSEIEMVKNY